MNVAKVLETYKQSYKKEKNFAIGKVNQELKKQEILKNQLISHYSKDLLPESTRKRIELPKDFSFYISIMLLFFTLMFILVSYFCFLTPPDSIFEVNYIEINILFLLTGTHCLYCCKHKIIKYNIKKLFFALKTLSKIHSFFNVFSYK